MPGQPQAWNDWLALMVLVGVPALWITAGLSDTVLGATIAGWMLVVQYYFRRSPPDAGRDDADDVAK